MRSPQRTIHRAALLSTSHRVTTRSARISPKPAGEIVNVEVMTPPRPSERATTRTSDGGRSATVWPPVIAVLL